MSCLSSETGAASSAFHLGDGGYFDNFGVFSTLDFLDRIEPAGLLGEPDGPLRRLILIQIRATPEGAGAPIMEGGVCQRPL